MRSVFLMIFSISAYGQMDMKTEEQIKVDIAIANVQQVGNFYFIPLDETGFTRNSSGDYYQVKTRVAQLVITIMSEFENRKNLNIISFTVERDQNAYTTSSKLHGIFVKAAPKAPTTPKK